MTPQELKNGILQLAIQGKLVEQRPEEGTAEELYRRIQAETGSKGSKRSKDLAASVADPVSDPPFEIPESWRWAKLGACCDMYTGNSISEGEKSAKFEGQKDGFDYIGTKDVSFKQTIHYDNGVKIPFDKEIDFKKARAGAILLCVEGGSAGRKIAILDRDVCFGNKLCMFMSNTLLNTYLFFFLQSMEFRKVFSENMTGIIGGVSIKKLKEIQVPIPPLLEQKRIVAKIEELLPLVDRYERAWSKLEDFTKRFPGDMQKSLLQMAIQGKLVEQRPEEGTGEELLGKILAAKKNLTRSRGARGEKAASALSAFPREAISDDENPFDIPESWEWVRLKDIGDIVTGATPNKSESDLYGGQYPFYKPAELDQGYNVIHAKETLSDVGWSKARRLSVGSVLVTCIGATIGKTGIIRREGSCNQQINAIIPYEVVSEYLYYVIISAWFQSSLKADASRTTLPIMNKRKFENLLVPLPPLAEQKRIVAKLEELLPLCERLKKNPET